MSNGKLSRKKFIGLGLGSVEASVIVGCGGGGSAGSGGTTTANGATGGGPKVDKSQAIVKESEVGPNSAFPFTDAGTGQQSVLVRLENGNLVAYSAVLPAAHRFSSSRPAISSSACLARKAHKGRPAPSSERRRSRGTLISAPAPPFSQPPPDIGDANRRNTRPLCTVMKDPRQSLKGPFSRFP